MCWGSPRWPQKRSRATSSRLKGTQGLLIVDEAQHLSAGAIDQLRAVHDRAEVGLALLGNEEVWSRIDGGGRKAQAQLNDTQSERSQQVELTKAGSPVQWAPVAISGVILVVFGVMLYLVFSRSIPAGSQSLGDILTGTLGGMATQVGNFWLGSSSGSQVKTHLLAAKGNP